MQESKEIESYLTTKEELDTLYKNIQTKVSEQKDAEE